MARRRKWTPNATILPKYSEQSGWKGKQSRHAQIFLRHAPLSETTLDALWLTTVGGTANYGEELTRAEVRKLNARWRKIEAEVTDQ